MKKIKNKALMFILSISLLIHGMIVPVWAANVSAYDIIYATTFDRDLSNQGNREFEIKTNRIGTLWHDNYLAYNDVDFGEISPFSIEVAAGGSEEWGADMVLFKLDSPDGKIIAEVPVTKIAFATPVTNKAKMLASVTGVHDIYVTTNKNTVNLYHFQFFAEQPEPLRYNPYIGNNVYTGVEQGIQSSASELLWQLGILGLEKGVEFDSNMPVSRGEFADAIYGLMVKRERSEEKVEDDVVACETKFSDIDPSYKYAEAIKYVSDYNIMNGVSEAEFRPGELITGLDAATVLLRVLGYGKIAEVQGGYPNGYLRLAISKKICSGNIMNEVVRRDDLVEMLYNALKTDYYSVTGIVGNTQEQYEIFTEFEGVLYEFQRTNYGEGRVESTALSNLYTPDSGLDTNSVMINGTVYDVGECQVLGLIGIEVEFFYEENGNMPVLRAIAPTAGVEFTILNSKEYDIEFNDYEINYYAKDSNKKKTIKIDSKTSLIYNGVASENKLTSVLSNPTCFTGFVYIVENNDDTKVITIDEYCDYVVESVDSGRNTIKARDIAQPIVWSDEDYVFIQNLSGEEVDVRNINRDDVITAYSSKNSKGPKVIRMYQSNTTVTGSINRIESDNRTIYVNNTPYLVSNTAFVPALGQTGVFKINIYGDIVSYGGTKTSDWSVGLFMDKHYSTKAFKENISVKILTADGKNEVYEVADRITADGLKIKEAEEIFNGKIDDGIAWIGLDDIASETAIRYQINKDGKLSMIDTPVSGSEDSYSDTMKQLTIGSDTTKFGYYRNFGILYEGRNNSKSYHFPNSSTVFAFYGVENRDERCIVGTAYELFERVEIQPWGDLYSTYGDDYSADVFVWNNAVEGMNTLRNDVYFIFDSIRTAIDSDGDIVTKVIGWSSGSEVEYTLDENGDFYVASGVSNLIKSAKPGNVYKLNLLSKENIMDATLLVAYDGNSTDGAALSKNGARTTATTMADHSLYGTVIDHGDNYVVVDKGNEGIEVLGLKLTFIATFTQGSRHSIVTTDIKGITVGDTIFAYTDSEGTEIIVLYPDVYLEVRE